MAPEVAQVHRQPQGLVVQGGRRGRRYREGPEGGVVVLATQDRQVAAQA